MFTRSLCCLAISALPAFAQGKAPTALADVRDQWKEASNYVLQSAIDMPEAQYSYKPTAAVRSFGELVGHVAGSQQMFCALALGEKPPAEDAVEKAATSKAALVDALKASNAACEKAYSQKESGLSAKVSLFGTNRTRMYTLMMNAMHDMEHYGNIVTYLRMNNMVPPSSKPAT